MPEITVMEVKPREVKKGDLIDGVAEVVGWNVAVVRSGKTRIHDGHMVESMKRTLENVTFETTGGKIVVRDTEHDVMVIRREVETEAEKKAKRIERQAQLEAHLIKEMQQLVDADPLQHFLGKMDQYRSDIGRGCSWHVPELIEAGARQHIARVFFAMLDHEDATVLDTARKLVASATKNVVQHARSNLGNSRSTSLMSNLSEDITVRVWAEIVDGYSSWYSLNSVIWNADYDKEHEND